VNDEDNKGCTHDDCRETAIANLRWIAPLLGCSVVVRMIREMHDGRVRCYKLNASGRPVQA
jgi:hypothetical protein